MAKSNLFLFDRIRPRSCFDVSRVGAWRPDQGFRWPLLHIDDGCGSIGSFRWVNSDPSENSWGVSWFSDKRFRD
jgi:hypothetical protein